MNIFEDLRSRVIRDVTTAKDDYILQQFARHGYSRTKVMELIVFNKIAVSVHSDESSSITTSIFIVDGESIFRLVESWSIDSSSCCSASYNIICDDLVKPLSDEDGVGMILKEFMDKYDFDFEDIVLKSHITDSIIRDPGSVICHCEVMSVNGNIITVR
jgi:hypothetical protein